MLYAAFTLVASLIIDLLTLSSNSALNKDLELLALRHQFRMLQRQLKSKPRASRREKLLLAVLAVKLKSIFKRQRYRLDQCLLLFKPNTVLKWHRDLVRRKWTFQSRRTRRRPRHSPELEALVLRLARENERWGVDRIHGELLKLGFRIGATTIRAILRGHSVLPAPERGANGGSWRRLLKHYRDRSSLVISLPSKPPCSTRSMCCSLSTSALDVFIVPVAPLIPRLHG